MIKTEPLTRDTVAMLTQIAGIGALAFRWNIDYEVGAGIIDEHTKCIWTKDGLRTTASYERGTAVLSQSKKPDPEYFLLKDKK